MSGQKRYAAFISYAHIDEAVAARLHKALETYPVPKSMPLSAREQLFPIFRDAAELSAHHSLSNKIREAVEVSRYLIVLCSPAAKDSHWVNEEIRLFRQLHGEASILAVLCEGDPSTAFPQALLEEGREPLAANLGASGDSFRLGVTQLAASMLGVGLDQLIQRDAQRRRSRVRLLVGGSMVFTALMCAMTWMAVNARDAAETSRSEAEKMVEFMLTDLKQDLEPVGQLDILDTVGNRVAEYYDAIPLAHMDDDRLSRQARARHLLGQVAIDQGKAEKAMSEIDAAYLATQEALRRQLQDTDAIFAHAQSEYWKGAMYYQENDFEAALSFMENYASLSYQLYQLDPNNFDWIMEMGWSFNNVASMHSRLKNYSTAEENYFQAKTYFELALINSPQAEYVEIEVANVFAGLAEIAVSSNDKDKCLLYRQKQIAIYEAQLQGHSDNYSVLYRKVQAQSLSVLDGLYDHRPDELLEIVTHSLEAYDRLLKHDPMNITWKNNYIDYLEQLAFNISQGETEKIKLENIQNLLLQIKNP